ncbi:MAG: fumarylacetoacetate hydrolase family protein [Legionellales bacterium]|nr:fumarylacetoacetate hydrolase family protein [Legionellales bacterium]
MKLATRKNHTRDGELMIVSRDLRTMISAKSIAPTLQYALENWEQLQDALQELSQRLNQGSLNDTFPYHPQELHSPLPRAYQWADGSAYVNHVELVRKARGAELPEEFWTDPLMYQGCSDAFIAPTDDILVQEEAWGIDFEAEVAIITDDVPMGVSVEMASQHIKLVMLVNDVSLRNLIPAELNKGFGFFQSKPASSFSPVAVTLDELGCAWQQGKVHLPLISHLNSQLIGKPNAGVDMTFNFPQLIAHAAKSRFLSAGSIIGSGTVSNIDRSYGSSCLAEIRMLEKINQGEIKTPFMRFGDRIRIEMLDEQGHSIFGAIDQVVKPYLR